MPDAIDKVAEDLINAWYAMAILRTPPPSGDFNLLRDLLATTLRVPIQRVLDLEREVQGWKLREAEWVQAVRKVHTPPSGMTYASQVGCDLCQLTARAMEQA